MRMSEQGLNRNSHLHMSMRILLPCPVHSEMVIANIAQTRIHIRLQLHAIEVYFSIKPKTIFARFSSL